MTETEKAIVDLTFQQLKEDFTDNQLDRLISLLTTYLLDKDLSRLNHSNSLLNTDPE